MKNLKLKAPVKTLEVGDQYLISAKINSEEYDQFGDITAIVNEMLRKSKIKPIHNLLAFKRTYLFEEILIEMVVSK